MSFQVFPNWKNSQQHNSSTKVLLLTLSLILISSTFLCLLKISHSRLPSPKFNMISSLRSIGIEQQCDVFSGEWVPHPQGPYYTNETCHLMIDQQNCMKFGRPDTEFTKWRWNANDCELPLFDAAQFIEMVKGKSMAFVGDSLSPYSAS